MSFFGATGNVNMDPAVLEAFSLGYDGDFNAFNSGGISGVTSQMALGSSNLPNVKEARKASAGDSMAIPEQLDSAEQTVVGKLSMNKQLIAAGLVVATIVILSR